MGPPDDDAPMSTTAEGRYRQRARMWANEPNGGLMHRVHWVLHNCVIHPLLGMAPTQEVVDLHQLSSSWLNNTRAYYTYFRATAPQLAGKRGAWLWHNCVIHPLIGWMPHPKTFAMHDQSAHTMRVEHWV